MISKYLLYLQETARDFEATGSIAPTSRAASLALTSPLSQDSFLSNKSSRKILEIGAGSGAITKVLVRQLKEDDTLHLCEMNPRMMAALRANKTFDSNIKLGKDQIHFHECPVQELAESISFDFIVCSLPFLNFPTALIEEIFQKIQRISHPQSILTFFEYLGVRPLRMSFPFTRSRMLDTNTFFEDLFQRNEFASQVMWRNFPPMKIHYLRFAND